MTLVFRLRSYTKIYLKNDFNISVIVEVRLTGTCAWQELQAEWTVPRR